MTKVAYLDCPTGIAGDMCLGALIDAGVPLEYLAEGLSKLGIAEEYQLRVERVQRNGQQATKLLVVLQSSNLSSDRPDGLKSADRKETIATNPSAAIEPGSEISSISHPSHSASEISDASDFTASHPHTTHHSHSPAHAHHQAHSHDHSHSPSHSDHSHSSAHDHSHSSAHAHQHLHPSIPHHSNGHHSHPLSTSRHLPEIEHLILQAELPVRVERWSLAIFRRLAEAEAAVHGIPPEQVHFHEVGAVDAIVDIVGSCLGLDWLGVEKLYCSALPTGGGTVRAAHGRIPVPAPAVLKLWEMRQIPIYSNGIDREMVTPTGAAIVTTLATQFGPPPAMTLLRVGLGAGTIDLPIPNILRLWIGERSETQVCLGEAIGEGMEVVKSTSPPSVPVSFASRSPDRSTVPVSSQDTIARLETQIDDLNPQAIGYVLEALLQAGALDVFTQAIGMKKSRPGWLLTVICKPEDIEACEALLFRETTTLGIRRSLQQRRIQRRELHAIETPYGSIRVKIAWADNTPHPTNVQPEYEDCAQIARQQNIPWREVHQIALQTWYQHHQP